MIHSLIILDLLLTEIQKKASPIILQKRDCLVIAPTGSGKTECSVIPIFLLVKKSKKLGKIAVTIMSGYVVGADTAARILRNMIDEEHIFKQIYEAERQYVVTRGFWDS